MGCRLLLPLVVAYMFVWEVIEKEEDQARDIKRGETETEHTAMVFLTLLL